MCLFFAIPILLLLSFTYFPSSFIVCSKYMKLSACINQGCVTGGSWGPLLQPAKLLWKGRLLYQKLIFSCKRRSGLALCREGIITASTDCAFNSEIPRRTLCNVENKLVDLYAARHKNRGYDNGLKGLWSWTPLYGPVENIKCWTKRQPVSFDSFDGRKLLQHSN